MIMKAVLVFVLAILLVKGDHEYEYEPDGGYYSFTTIRSYRERGTNEPPFVGGLLREMDIYFSPNTILHEGRYKEEAEDFFVNGLIPEFCDVTPETCSVRNTFLLDCNCVRGISKMKGACSNTICDIIKRVHSDGPALIKKIFLSDNVEEVVGNVHEAFNDLIGNSLCECGDDLVNALLNCAEGYDSNVFSDVDCDVRLVIQRFLRTVDIKSYKGYMNKLRVHLCVETDSGTCFDDLFGILKQFGMMTDNTLARYEEHDEAGWAVANKMEEACDDFLRLKKPLEETIEEYDNTYFDELSDKTVKNIFSPAADFMNSLYCNKGCKNTISAIYPCCLKSLLEDKKMFKQLEEYIESIVDYISDVMQLDGDVKEYWDYIEPPMEYSTEMEPYKVPKELKDLFMEIIHPAKYCKGKSGPTCQE